MKKTKLEIMKDIKEFAKDDEVTPSFIRKYLIEILQKDFYLMLLIMIL